MDNPNPNINEQSEKINDLSPPEESKENINIMEPIIEEIRNTEQNTKIEDDININSIPNTNTSNIPNPNTELIENLKPQIINELKLIQEMSNNNDENSIQLFNIKIPQVINGFLGANLITYDLHMFRLIFQFFTNYIQIRANYIDSMPNPELAAMLRILEPNFPFHMNLGNILQNVTREEIDEFLSESFPDQKNGIINQNLKLSSNTNIFFNYLLIFVQKFTNLFTNLIHSLNQPMLDFERFFYVYTHLSTIMYYYETFDQELVLQFIKAITNYYNRLFENNSIKELHKNYLENFFKSNNMSDFQILFTLGDNILENENFVNDPIFKEFLTKDLKMIHQLISSQNLERRVLGINSLSDLINNILSYEKLDENSLTNKNMKYIYDILKVKKNLVLEWLNHVGIFQILFGENIHEAILKKSSVILIFLYINHKMNFDQIDFIWKISQDKHEAVSGSILNIFSDLISYFSIEHAMHILKIINEIPFKEVNDVTIKILDSFSNNKCLQIQNLRQENIENNENKGNNVENILNNENELNLLHLKTNENNLDLLNLIHNRLNNDTKDVNDFKSFYLKILWKFSSDNSFYSGLSYQIISKSRKVFTSILLKPVFTHELAKYLKKCILSINNNYLIWTDITVLDQIIKNMKHLNSQDLSEILKSTYNNEVKDLKTFFDYLEKNYCLTSTILNSILSVKKEVMLMAGEIIDMQSNLLNCGGENISNNILNNYEIKFDDSNILKCIKEESKENQNNSYNFMINEMSNLNNNNLINEENISRLNNLESNIIMENVNVNNLDETLSTEKSLEDSISSISTEISSLEKSRIYLVKEFIENNLNNQTPLYKDNLEIIFKKLKLTFSNQNYYSVTNALLEFYKNILFSSNIQITQSQIEYLFILLVENAVDEDEMNMFYNFFAEIFRFQQMTKQNYISEENFNFILFELILKIELSSLPFSGFNLFKQIFFYINSTHNNMTIQNQKIIEIKDFYQLVGFETLWKFYLETKNFNISNESQQLLVSIITILAKKEEKESFIFIFEKIFSNLESFYQLLTNQNMNQNMSLIDYEEMTNKMINILFIVNSTKEKLSKHKIEILNLNIQNFFLGADGKKTQINANSDTTIKDLKGIILTKVIFPNSNSDEKESLICAYESNLMLLSRGRILKNENLTLKDLKIENNALIQIHKGEMNQSDMEIEVSEDKLQELIMMVKNLFESLEDEIIKRALKKNSYNADDTVVFLFDEEKVNDIRIEIQEENVNTNVIGKNENNFDLFTEDKLKLLIDLLDLELISINKNIWQLLTAIKFPQSFIDNLIDTGIINFENIFNTEKPNQMLIKLRILNCLIFNDKFFNNLNKLEESKINEWKMNFLVSDGLNKIIMGNQKVIEFLEKMDASVNYCLMSSYIQNLQIMSKWMHFFTFSTAINLAGNRESLGSLIVKVIQMRPAGINIGLNKEKINESSNINNADNIININIKPTTPTFGSLHSSFSNEDKAKPHKTKSNFPLSEEYEIPIEEEVVNAFYIQMISTNFHMNILNFIQFATKQTTLIYFQNETETILLHFLEILNILNELNPDCFKTTLHLEFENSFIINLLFVEKSKFVRKTVENLFILMTQHDKNYDVNVLNLGLRPEIKTLKQFMTIHIIKNYQRIYNGQVYEEFFNLFGLMLQTNEENHLLPIEDFYFNVKDLAFEILSIIYKLSLKNDFEFTEIEQEQLSGNIHLFQCLCANHDDNIIQSSLDKFNEEYKINLVKFVYRNLFVIESDSNENDINNKIDNNREFQNVRFKYSQRSLRHKAYNLLISLMRLNEYYRHDLSQFLITHHTSQTAFKNEIISNIDLEIGLRSKNDKFIGLRNYGCTCYLNALLQQLYMIPSFKNGIYSVPIISESQDNTDNPLYQLQLVFANLDFSLKQYHTPLHFIKSLKAFNNEPINVSIQQDCEEFLNILIDRLEQKAKEVNMEHILDDSIKSKLSYETISMEKDTPYYSENVSHHLAINLDIKNKRSIEEALDLFVKGEILEGENKYHVEEYQKKISVMRRCSIKSLPNNVIIHLKRFEFDYNTFEKVKLNDYCEFPIVMDFKPWMRATIVSQSKEDMCVDVDELNQLSDPDAFKYKLTGVLVHSGHTADGGHYFSYIYDLENEKWHRFDDSRVTDFNINDLKKECFGEDKDDLQNGQMFNTSQNAYLLFYTKINHFNQNENINQNINNVNYLPTNLLNQIKEENMQFLKYKNFLDNDYFQFFKEFLQYSVLNNKTIDKLSMKEKSMSKQDRINEDIYNTTLSSLNAQYGMEIKDSETLNDSDNFEKVKEIFLTTQENIIRQYKEKIKSPFINMKKKIIKLGVYFFFEIIIQQRDKYKTNSFTNFIIDMIETDKESSAWLLKKLINNINLFVDYILNNNYSEVREAFSRVVTNCIHSLYNEEYKYLNENYKYLVFYETEGKWQFRIEEQSRSSIMRFFKNNILDLFDYTRTYWNKFTQFMQIIHECFQSNHFHLVNLSFRLNLFNKIIFFLMNNQRGYETNYPTMGTKALHPNFAILIEILSLMTLSTLTPGVLKLKQYSIYSLYQSNDNNNINLPDQWQIILDKEVLGDNILRNYCTVNTIKMVHHLAWGDLDTSRIIIKDILASVKDFLRDSNSLSNLIKNAAGLLEVDDNMLRQQRMKILFSLDDLSEEENDSIFNYLMSYRDECTLNVMICLKLLGDLIKKYSYVVIYVINNANKLEWIYYFLKDIRNDENKRDNLQIEATTENYNFLELFDQVEDMYLNEFKLRNYLKLPEISPNVNNINPGQTSDNSFMLLDFNQEIENKRRNENDNPPHDKRD